MLRLLMVMKRLPTMNIINLNGVQVNVKIKVYALLKIDANALQADMELIVNSLIVLMIVHGTCNNGFFYCDVGWEGENCTLVANCETKNNCSFQDICDKTNKCLCIAGFIGDNYY
jgi:hypothetical protein